MSEGIGALGDDDPESGGSGRAPDSSSVDVDVQRIEADRDRERRLLEMLVGKALDVIPNMLAMRTGQKHFALNPEERQLGVEAWLAAVDALFPDLAKLSKVLAVLAAGVWTVSIVQTRFIMLAELKRRQMHEARARAAGGAGRAPGGGSPAGPEPTGGPMAGESAESAESVDPDGPEPWDQEGAPS